LKKYFIFCIYFPLNFFGQGIINSGAKIVTLGASQIYILGGSNAGYLSTANGIINPSAGSVFSLEGDWTNNSANSGFGNDAGTVAMTGAAQSINGTASTIFYHLNLMGSGTKSQNVNTGVGGSVIKTGIFSVGNVVYDLNSSTLNVRNPASAAITYGSGYVYSEVNAAINPSIIKWDIGTNSGSHIFPFGTSGSQIPFTFNVTSPMGAATDYLSVSTRATLNPSNTPWAGLSNVPAVVNMYNPVFSGDGSVQTVIDRWWDITSSNAVTADVIFSYRGVENTLIGPYNAGMLSAQHWNGGGWDPPVGSAAAVLAGVGSVSAFGLNTFSPWILSASNAPLPIELIEFTAECFNQAILIKWSTASEADNDLFVLEKSKDGENFQSLAFVSGAGTSQLKHSYSYLDKASDISSANYYRLKYKGVNGSNSYSKIIQNGNCEDGAEEIRIVNSEELFVLFYSEKEQSAKIILYDLLGRTMIRENVELMKGYSQKKIGKEDLSEGYYLLNVSIADQNKTQKIFISKG
jgi:hypothetical protein